MDKEKEFDIDKELKKISRKTDVNILKFETTFDNRLEQLDKDINKAIKSKEKMFDDVKSLTSKHIYTDYADSSIKRYKEKLNKI